MAAGVRRIEATTGAQSLREFQAARDALGARRRRAQRRAGPAAAARGCLQDDMKRLTRELQQAKTTAAMGGGGAGGAVESVQVAGVTLVARQVEGLDKDGLRALVDRHRDQIKSGVVVLAAPADGKVLIVAGVTPDLVKRIPPGRWSSSWRRSSAAAGAAAPTSPKPAARTRRRSPSSSPRAARSWKSSRRPDRHCGRAASGAPSSFRHTAPKPNPRARSSGISRAVASTVCR